MAVTYSMSGNFRVRSGPEVHEVVARFNTRAAPIFAEVHEFDDEDVVVVIAGEGKFEDPAEPAALDRILQELDPLVTEPVLLETVFNGQALTCRVGKMDEKTFGSLHALRTINDLASGLRPEELVKLAQTVQTLLVSAKVQPNEVSFRWTISDVQTVRPDLSDSQARDVLQRVRVDYDASTGVFWASIEEAAKQLYGPGPDDEPA